MGGGALIPKMPKVFLITLPEAAGLPAIQRKGLRNKSEALFNLHG